MKSGLATNNLSRDKLFHDSNKESKNVELLNNVDLSPSSSLTSIVLPQQPIYPSAQNDKKAVSNGRGTAFNPRADNIKKYASETNTPISFGELFLKPFI